MQLSTSVGRLCGAASRGRQTSVRTVGRQAAARKVLTQKGRNNKASFHTRALAQCSGAKKEVRYDNQDLPKPVPPTETFKHLDIPEDMMKDMLEFKEMIETESDKDQRVFMLDTVQTVATQVGLIQKAAAYLNKDAKDVTALDVAEYHLHAHEEFVSKTELDKVVLYSHTKELENFRAGVEIMRSRYPGKQLPPDLDDAMKKIEAELVNRAQNENILEVEVEEDVYQRAQQNLFPSMVKKGITARDLLDYVGGSDGLIDPVTFHVRDLMIQLEKAPDAQKTELLTELEQSIVSFEDSLPEEEIEDFGAENIRMYGLARTQQLVTEKLTHKLGRPPTEADFSPERRLARSLELNHPILDTQQKFYVHGDVTNVKEAIGQMMKDEAPTIHFQERADFNPPTGYRPFTRAQQAVEPYVTKIAQHSMLNFPMWEGPRAAEPINAAEYIVDMKLFRLFNYLYPMLEDSQPAQELFMELYDVSPGESTLEWALSYPPKEHTFFPEHPIWVHVFEDDEEIPPIVWPTYSPMSVDGVAEITSASGQEWATIKFLPHSKEAIAFDAHYNHVFMSLPVEKRFGVARKDMLKAISALSAGDKAKAESAWAALPAQEKARAREAWNFTASPEYTGAQYTAAQKAIADVEKRAISSGSL